MSIPFNLTEKRTFNYPFSKMESVFEQDFKELADQSKFIDSFNEIEENCFDIKTKEKKVVMKKLFLKTRLKYLVNKEKGLLHIFSINDIEDNNLKLDCKIRAIPNNEETIVAIKLEGGVDFGFSKVTNKGIKVFADKEIEKFLSELFNKFEVKSN